MRFTLEPLTNTLALGIAGFDVHAKRGNFSIKVGHEYLEQ